ncbi:MAG TPA: YbaY family lipoprotein [Allosphingosinicella sp.]|nr:YbaY family lipoprotein [Allosphingosinicella sp.]
MTPSQDSRTLKVRVHLPPGAVPSATAVLRVRVEDVSGADKAAPVIAEKVVQLSADADVTIEVPPGLVDPGATYSVFLHVDGDGSGNIDVGDFISPATHPVLTQGAPDAVEAELVRVGGRA